MEHKVWKTYRLHAAATLLAFELVVLVIHPWLGWPIFALEAVAAVKIARCPLPQREIEVPDYVEQLRDWCDAIGIDTPQVLDHQTTDLGERYYLRVTGHYLDDGGLRRVMTPETFAGFWRKFRALAGDGCHGVYISRPDKYHGGRCTMEVRWRDKANTRYAVEVMMSPTHLRMTYSPEETEAALAEARANGYEHPSATLAPPDHAE